ncbi:hypothetical protein OPV22_029770 [Ensete ventricosum]|uniref:Serine-threonine/tyrosine-protein kinase catalytic domain-containing protein n=1 Tax=Ensete ventricosum TaxID=4639 RepID=A0AAV8QA65_ENSVE|nr:hypothetical protein OPV22_029770 [Ensete ventricosum]
MRGHLTEKADVFAFGVLALEILSGRPNSDENLDQEKVYLLEWAWTLHENRRDLEMVDRKLTSFDKGVVSRIIGIALLCTQASPVLRPPMSRVVAMLVGDTEVTDVTLRPSYLTEWQHKDVSSSYVTGYFDSSTQRSANAQVSFPSTDRTTVNMETTPLTTQPYMKKAIKEGR